MAASIAKSGFGSVLTWNAVPVPELKQIGWTGVKGDTLDVTNMDSPNTFREFIAGVRDGGEISLSGNYTAAAGQAALKTDCDAGTKRTGNTLAFGSTPTATLTFEGYVTAFSIDSNFDAPLSFSATIKINAKPTIA